MPVKEYQIVEHFLGPALKDEVMKIMPVQKQTRAGQRTRFKVRNSCDTQYECLCMCLQVHGADAWLSRSLAPPPPSSPVP